jgi:hypothetical protein
VPGTWSIRAAGQGPQRSAFLGGAADVLVQRLRGFALDVTAPDAVELQAIRECCIVFQRDRSLLGLIGAHFGANAYPPDRQTVRR